MINPTGFLSHLLHHCDMLKQLNKIVKASLPVPLNQHCHVANFRNNILIIYSDSPLWANRLRFMTPELVSQLRQNRVSPTIEHIEIKVRPITGHI
ncbi:MAG: DUF721 domain-containing protein [Thiomargarita sp.]|nr:DUF721 domain-containing protein [Thiomargarita sp.]